MTNNDTSNAKSVVKETDGSLHAEAAIEETQEDTTPKVQIDHEDVDDSDKDDVEKVEDPCICIDSDADAGAESNDEEVAVESLEIPTAESVSNDPDSIPENAVPSEDDENIPSEEGCSIGCLCGCENCSTESDDAAEYAAAVDTVAELAKTESPSEYSIALEALIANDTSLTEDFRRTAANIFEAAVTSKVREHEELLAEELAAKTQLLEQQLQESINQVESKLLEKVDSYLSYVVEEWMQKNELAVETGLRTEITEGFMNSLKSLFTENYITIPETKRDICNELETRANELSNKLEESTSQVNMLSLEVEKLSREAVITRACGDLAKTQAVKLKSLVEDVKFTDETAFTNKVTTIKEAYFSSPEHQSVVAAPVNSTAIETIQTIVEDTNFPNVKSGSMKKYTDSLSRLFKPHN